MGQDQPPLLKSGVELVLVDVQVVDRKGEPIAGLKPQQFQVTLNGRRRTVASAELIDSNTGLPAGTPATAGAAPRPRMRPGSIYVLAVDQGSFRPVNAPSVVHAAREFLKRAQPNDYVGMISFPSPGVVINPTRERAELEQAIPKLVGFSAVKQMRQYTYSLSDAIDVASRDFEVQKRVIDRNCASADMMCASAVQAEMNETVSGLELQAARSLHGYARS